MVEAIIEHGVQPGFGVVDETGLIVKKTSFKGKRDWVEKTNAATRMISYVRGQNPLLDITVNGMPIATAEGGLQGICLLHPGNAAVLANWSGNDAVHGFAAADNKLVLFKDFTFDSSDEEDSTDDMNFTVYPGIAQPAP